jgi:2-polyprenyl-3-methyl-5-hydroxy-6-metoxy-1,4-benzoquinol methylase
MTNENEHLEKIASNSFYAAGLNGYAVKYSQSIFERHILPGSILELGPAEGIMTEFFVSKYNDITVVEGSNLFCKSLKNRFPNVKIVNSLFEDYEPDREYDNVILGHVLEHVLDPVQVLTLARKSLSPHGIVLSAVPNAMSIHRQAAVTMGLLSDIHELNATDAIHGHRRVYDPEQFKTDFEKAGLNVQKIGGYWIKPLSNKQIEETWTPDMINAFFKLGEQYPQFAAEIYVVASKGDY